MARSNLLSEKAKGKRKADAIESDSSATIATASSKPTKRGARSKTYREPNKLASQRGSLSAKASGKNLSLQTLRTHTIVPRDDHDEGQERIIFIDNHTQKPVLCLYRNTEDKEPMPQLWKSFIAESQMLRDQVGPDVLGSFLTQTEIDSIKLHNNAHIFPELLNSKGCLRTKDNTAAGANASRIGGVFTKSTGPRDQAAEFRARAKALRAKAAAFTKQAQAYDNAAVTIETGVDVDEKELAQSGMQFLGEELPLSRKELHSHLQAQESHLIALAEKIRGEMSPLAVYVSRAEKRLRDLIQLKVAADLKLLRDIQKYRAFEMQAWQIGALPQETHACKCSICRLLPTEGHTVAQYAWDSDFPEEVDIDNLLPEIKLEPDEEPHHRSVSFNVPGPSPLSQSVQNNNDALGNEPTQTQEDATVTGHTDDDKEEVDHSENNRADNSQDKDREMDHGSNGDQDATVTGQTIDDKEEEDREIDHRSNGSDDTDDEVSDDDVKGIDSDVMDHDNTDDDDTATHATATHAPATQAATTQAAPTQPAPTRPKPPAALQRAAAELAAINSMRGSSLLVTDVYGDAEIMEENKKAFDAWLETHKEEWQKLNDWWL